MTVRLSYWTLLACVLALAVGGCTTQELPKGTDLPPTPYLKVVSVENDFDERYLPNVIEIQLEGCGLFKYTLKLLNIEKGATPETGRLDIRIPDRSAERGRILLVLTSRPDPEGNPRALFPEEIYGFTLATRFDGTEPQSFCGPLEVWQKRRSALQVRAPGPIPPSHPEVLLVKWHEPLFWDYKEGFGPNDPPATLEQIVKRTATDSRVSAVVLVLNWVPR